MPCPRRTFLVLVAALALGLVASARAADATAYAPFHPGMDAGSAYTLDARRLHPTQSSLGWREVVAKTAVINGKDAAGLVAYLKDKDVPVVIGPGGVPYMTDGHHTLRALIESSQPDKTVYGHIIANWSALAPSEFWTRMQAANHTYLKDATGRPIEPSQLPASLPDMQRDRYRGLAWAVMVAGGFAEKKGTYFQEFFWADFFRSRVRWDDADDRSFANAVERAVEWARHPDAAHLPGYLGKEAAAQQGR